VSPLFDVRGKVCLVTGSTRGIGKAMVWRLAEAGARVTVSSRKAEACEQVASEINAAFGDGSAIAVPCNASDKAQLQTLVDQTREAFGPIDVAIANAGTNPHFGPSETLQDSAFLKILQTNLVAVHWLFHMVLPEMRARRQGRLIVTSSNSAFMGQTALGAYSISKAADLQLVRNFSKEFGPEGITVNAIAPGLVRTDMSRALWEDPEILRGATQGSDLRRIGEPDEIAGLALFLASPASGFMTGQCLVADGGVVS
jgi:NAD(P)-dependent dehydrogenase (short-subunit alcohol dehydrogenase family)